MSTRPERDSIWSVPQGALPWYYGVFGAQVFAGGWILWVVLTERSGGWYDRLIPFWQYLAPVAIASASSTIIVIEVVYAVYAALVWIVELWRWLRGSGTKPRNGDNVVIGNYFIEKLRRRRKRLLVTPREVVSIALEPDDPATNPPRVLDDTVSPESSNMPNLPGPPGEE